MKLWGGRFDPDRAGKGAEAFTPSIDFDQRLYREDIAGSQAHARMLARVGLLTSTEATRIVEALDDIRREIESGEFPFKREFEDIHLNIEHRLTELVGDLGKKLHTARSRNDQVALDMHLFARARTADLQEAIKELQAVLLRQASDHVETIMPGYTHLQRAQPVVLGHHLMAYFWMLERDYGRLTDSRKRTNIMPLGAGALAGTSFPINPQAVADELGFERVYDNSMDAVSDRDFVLELMSACSLIMIHLSRLAEELVVWASTEFRFIEFDDAYSTGSSIMPQKKNPDVAELIRGKSGRVVGNLMGLLTVIKGLPLAYHSDMQEDKEALFDSVDTTLACLHIMAGALGTARFNRERMMAAVREDYSNATDLADYLVRKGLPFREAHAVVGNVVAYCITQNRLLTDLEADELTGFHPLLTPDALDVLDPVACVKARTTYHGTAPSRVRAQLERARALLGDRDRNGK